MAKLHFKYGAMNSGKSDTLIKTAYNYTERGLNVITIKPSVDTKSEASIIARGGASRVVDILIAPKTDLYKAVQDFKKKNTIQELACILVDEAQFLDAHQIDDLFKITKVDGTSVIAYGLRADFRTELFPGSKRLLEIADNIEKLPTMCRCGNQAEFNCRKIDDEFVFEGEQVAIDGEQKVSYESLCGVCYLEEKAKAHAKI
jgi:thymidine kinase